METREKTVKQWLHDLANTDTSNVYDERMMQVITRKCGFPNSVVTCGIVYLEGHGNPIDIHTTAREILKRQIG